MLYVSGLPVVQAKGDEQDAYPRQTSRESGRIGFFSSVVIDAFDAPVLPILQVPWTFSRAHGEDRMVAFGLSHLPDVSKVLPDVSQTQT